jgi:hypothetical protein
VVVAQRGDIGVLAKPPRAEYGVPEAGQRPGAGAGAAVTALGVQQSGEIEGQLAGDVECGTMSDHGSLWCSDLIFANPVLPGASRPSPGGASSVARSLGQAMASISESETDLVEITSLSYCVPSSGAASIFSR